jgi:hypothetical protein
LATPIVGLLSATGNQLHPFIGLKQARLRKIALILSACGPAALARHLGPLG